MKKLGLFFLLLSFSGLKAQVQYEANAGVTIGSITSKINDKIAEGLKAGVGYSASVHACIPISSELFFQAGIQYESVRNKVNHTTTVFDVIDNMRTETYSGKTNIEYINIPVEIFIKATPVDHGIRAGLGPVIGIAIAGHTKYTNIVDESTLAGTTHTVYKGDSKIQFGSSDSTLKRINLGLRLDCSYLFKSGLIIGIYSTLGFSNIDNRPNITTKTTSSGLTIGYNFYWKRKLK